MKWSFPSNNNGDINGISNSGVETFQGTPLKSLAREICQNSLDAAVSAAPVEVEFKLFTLRKEDFPDLSSLRDAFIASLDFWKLQSSKKTQDFFERAIELIDNRVITFLRVSDFNTTGLLGSHGEYNTPWCNLTKSSGASDKAGTSGGSFGIGKFAPFACSDFRTVFYNTFDIEGISAFQGISRITSFRRKNDNEITVGVGYFGAENNLPVYKQLNLDENFYRKENQTGTDIFIAGFKYQSADWKTDIITAVLDGFLYAIYRGSLIVKVDDVKISRETLPALIEEYKTDLNENADKYYTVLTSDKTVWNQIDFKNYGKISLGLIIEPEMHRKVAMIRRTGMKIMNQGNISGVIPFAGVMLIEGEKINDFLRSIENPQHTKWEPARAINQGAAKIFIRDLISYIKDCLDKLKQNDITEEINPDVGEYLPDENDDGYNTGENEAEAIVDTIKTVETTIVLNKNTKVNITEKGQKDLAENDSGEIESEKTGSGSGHNDGTGSCGGEGNGENEGVGGGPNAKKNQKSLASITADKVRVVCLDKQAGKYSIIFVPATSAENGRIDLFLSAESQNYEAPIVSATGFGSSSISVVKNSIYGLSFVKNVPLRLIVFVNYSDYCSMEVTAYGYKI
ncbi:MAG: hypothetical protein AB9883_00980 [Acidaminococcaceae bacterium]